MFLFIVHNGFFLRVEFLRRHAPQDESSGKPLTFTNFYIAARCCQDFRYDFARSRFKTCFAAKTSEQNGLTSLPAGRQGRRPKMPGGVVKALRRGHFWPRTQSTFCASVYSIKEVLNRLQLLKNQHRDMEINQQRNNVHNAGNERAGHQSRIQLHSFEQNRQRRPQNRAQHHRGNHRQPDNNS